MRILPIMLTLIPVLAGQVASQVPDTEIYLAALRVADGKVTVGEPRNITNRAGYDNQPFFTRDGQAILYTARVDDSQTDIFRYDLRAQRVARVTDTPESEYSPTPLERGGFAVIRVEADSTQRLWRFDDAGRNPGVLLPDIKPVGYQAWIDGETAAIFVLGRPATLRIANLRTGRADSIAAGIGRAIQKIPDWPGASFVEAIDSVRWLKRVHGTTRVVQAITKLPAGGEYHAWMPGGVLLASAGSQLFEWESASNAWRVAADFTAQGLRLSRIAISPRGDWIAMVVERVSR